MSTDATLQELIERGPTGLTPWPATESAELGAYMYRAAVFLPGDDADAARIALSVALVVHLGSRGALVGAALAEATGAVIAALGVDPDGTGDIEGAFGVGIITYREATAREGAA